MRIKSDTQMVMVCAGVLLLVLISGLAAFAPDVLTGVFFIVGLSYLFWIKNQYIRLDMRREAANIAKVEREARFSAVGFRHGVVAFADDEIQFFTKPTNPAGARIGADATSGNDDAIIPLNHSLLKYDRVLIIGGMGCGKSELLKHLAHDRSRQGECIIIDSHASPSTWPSGRVVGMGRDYGAIEAEINRIMAEMDCRYQLYSTGEQTEFKPLTLIIDEMTVMNQFTDVSAQIKSLLCECRKVNIRLVMAGQSDRAGALGLRGNYDLITGFEAICYLEKDPATGDYYGTVKTGNGADKKYYHPGIFSGPYQGRNAPYQDDVSADTAYSVNNSAAIGYDEREKMNTEAQQVIYDCIYYADTPMRGIDVATSTGLDAGYTRVALSRMHKSGLIHRNNNATYEIWR